MKTPVILMATTPAISAPRGASQLREAGYIVQDAPPERPEVLPFLCSPPDAPDLLLLSIHWGGENGGFTAAERILDQQDLPILFLLPPDSGPDLREKAEALSPYGWMPAGKAPFSSGGEPSPPDSCGCFPAMIRQTLLLARKNHELRERKKEIACLEQMGELANRPDLTEEALLREIPAVIAAGLLYPDEASVRIIWDGKAYSNRPFPEQQPLLRKTIACCGQERGGISASYQSSHPERDHGPFLKEEDRLLTAIADRLGHIIERLEISREYRKLYEQAPVGIFRSTSEGRILKLNRTMAHLLGAPHPRDILEAGVSIPQAFYKYPRQRDELLSRLEKEGRVDNMPITLLKLDGSCREIAITARRLGGGGSWQFQLEGFLTDITEAEKARKKVSQLLESKKTLLKEIHHRVKNNFNTVISLLNLQSSRVASREAQQAILEASNRVRSIAEIYTHLYRQDSFNTINLKAFLEGIVSPIIQSYEREKGTLLHLDIQEFDIPVSHGAKWGIVINELITNSFKYARPDPPPLSISLELRKDSSSRLILLYQDNGTGIPEEVIREKRFGLGLGMIENLVTPAGGRLHFDQQEGSTRIRIETEPME